jgi:hypothetical protein
MDDCPCGFTCDCFPWLTDSETRTPTIDENCVTPTATHLTGTQIAAAAEAIFFADGVETLTLRAALEIVGALTGTILTELAHAMTQIGTAHGWPNPAVLQPILFSTGQNVALFAMRDVGDSRLQRTELGIGINPEGVVVYFEYMEIAVACPPELLAALLAGR